MNTPLVGAFVLAGAALFVAVVLWLSSGGAFGQAQDRYLAIEEESVAGLSPDAPVKYNGVDVGRVESIALDPADPQRVRLLFALVRGTPIRVDTVAVLKTQGLTGIAYVELEGGRADAPLLTPREHPPYATILTKPSLTTRLENVLTTVLAKLDHTSSTVDALLSPANREAFTAALADIATVARTLAAQRATIDEGLRRGAATLRGAQQVTDTLQLRLGPLLTQVDDGTRAVQRLAEGASADATRAADTVVNAGTEWQRLAADTRGDVLPQLAPLLRELQDLSVSLRALAAQARREPAALLYGAAPPTVPDPGEGGAAAAPDNGGDPGDPDTGLPRPEPAGLPP